MPAGATIRAHLTKLPLAFEPNLGQAEADVRYLSRGPGPRLELTDTEVRLAAPATRRGRIGMSGAGAVSLRLAGQARPHRVESAGPLPGKVHDYDGDDPHRWRRDIPTFQRVVYREVYPATDLVFHGSQDAVEFDFVLRPGATAGAIGIDVGGAETVTLDGQDVVIRSGGDTLRVHAPLAYQDSATGRARVAGRFRIEGSRIGFDVGAYDAARPLVIDPVVTYSTYLGDAGSQAGAGLGVDAAGSIYVAADRIVKLSADGQTLLYAVSLGDMQPRGLAVDGAGNAYVVTTCPYPRSGVTFVCPTVKPLASGRPQAQGDSGTYVTKLDPEGSLLFSTSVGGLGDVVPGGIAVDGSGNMYVTAWNTHGDFPLTRPAFTVEGEGFHTVVEAIAADASRFLYAVEFQTGGDIFEPSAPAVDRTGAAYVTGATASFPTTPGVLQPTGEPGEAAGVVAKIAPDSSLAYATFFGNATTVPTAIAVDAGGNAYITGHTGSGLPTVNAMQPALAGGASDAFVARLNARATALVFSTYLGGRGDDAALAIALDRASTIYLAGPTTSVDFPQQNALPPAFGHGASNFVTAMAPDGRSLVYSTYFADAQTTVAALQATATGTVYLTGSTTSPSFPTVRPVQETYGGSGDAFVAILAPSEPRAFLTRPAAGATVSGLVWTDVWVQNFAGASNAFTLTVGDTVVAQGTATNHATLAWDSRSIPDGVITLTATVRDAAGHVGIATRTLVVLNGGGALGVFITSPAAGATVSGIAWSDIWVEGATAGSRTFTLSIGGTTLATASATGNHLTLPWDSSLAASGPQTVVATVRDAAGHAGVGTRAVIIQNGLLARTSIPSPPAIGATR